VRYGLVVLLLASSAHADNALQARVEAEASKSWLELDPVIEPRARAGGLLVTNRRETRDTIALDARTALTLVLDEWANKEGAVGYRDVRGQGWQASARLMRDLGWARFTITAAIGDVDTRYTRGRYTDVGASLLHVFRLSRKRTGWAGLTVGRRTWQGGEPPPGEANGMQVMAVIGFTF
jgi:hypothetical protein